MVVGFVGLGFLIISLFLPWGGPQTLLEQKVSVLSFLGPDLLAYLVIFLGFAFLAYLVIKNLQIGFGVSFILLLVTVGILLMNLIIRCQEVACNFNEVGFSPIVAIIGLSLYSYSFRIKR